ncbi:MAG: hypothetical protein LBE32_01840 [Burkholderiales bacterium]|jgi:hypothetical protein|nr:hypothetical protein [Burkholderiales bacterium]
MTTHQVHSIWGAPESITTNASADGTTESGWYTKHESHHLLTIRDDKVSPMSNHEPFGSRTTSEPEATAYKREPIIRECEAQEREDKAKNRRYLRQSATREKVRSDPREPDNKNFQIGLECWNYSPESNDSQSRTTICFDNSGNVHSIDRFVERGCKK